MHYNKDINSQQIIDEPKTWQTMEKLAQHLRNWLLLTMHNSLRLGTLKSNDFTFDPRKNWIMTLLRSSNKSSHPHSHDD